MPHALIGTAGHVDHGKTRLVLALTGIDCDRFAEEKARGITIDIGFAHLERGDLQLGFVDVPGHERFLHNALAGLGGIRVLLLVVAADEGVRPQTREHLAIATLLGIPRAVVALTKLDLVGADLADLAALEVGELLAGTPFATAPILPVSSATGEGIAALEAALIAAATAELAALERAAAIDAPGATSHPPAIARPARLPIDRAFHLKGQGVVVTGTLVSGEVRAGDALRLHPGGISVRVRSVQVHGQPRAVAEAGERTAVQIAGAELDALARGAVLTADEAFAPSRRLAVTVSLLPDAPALRSGFTPVRCHLFSTEVLGMLRPVAPAELAPGETGLAELKLRAPLVAVRGDRFILRRPSPPATLGGGIVLDPSWRPRRRTERNSAIQALAGDERAAVLLWAREAGLSGLATADLARRLGYDGATAGRRLAALAGEQKLLEVPLPGGAGSRYLLPAQFQELTQRVKSELAEFFARDRLARGMPRAEAVKRLFPGRAVDLADVLLGWLEKSRALALDGDLVTQPGRRDQLTGEESSLAQRIVEHLEGCGLAPPSPGELARALDAKPQILDGVLRFLVTRGKVARLPGGLMIAVGAIEALRRDLLATGWERFSVPQFKERFGLSRKWAIPLLEHLDSLGVTRRLGDERQLRRPG